ncbi:MAG: type II secretion system protein [Eubacterium sp.]
MVRYNFLKNQSGFTLTDLVVVTAIICLLAAILIPGYLHFIDEAKKQSVVAEARVIYVASQVCATELKGTETPEHPYHIPNADDLRPFVGPDDIYNGVTTLTITDDLMDGRIDKIEMIKNGINVILEPGKTVLVDGKEAMSTTPENQY